MRFVFPLSEWTLLKHRPPCWYEHIPVCINSLLANTQLEPWMIWRGDEHHPLIELLAKAGVRTVLSGLPFDDALTSMSFKPRRSIDISRAVLMKVEASRLFYDIRLIVGDVDTLWLKDPLATDQTAPIAAGPEMWPENKRFNSGMTVIDCDHFRRIDVVARTIEILNSEDSGDAGDQFCLNKIFPEHDPLPWEQRAFWPMPSHTPSVVHFHGPKLDHIKDLEKASEHPDAAIRSLVAKGADSLRTWAGVASGYLRGPALSLEAVVEACTKK